MSEEVCGRCSAPIKQENCSRCRWRVADTLADTLAAEEKSKKPFCQMMAKKMHEEKGLEAAKGSGDRWSDKDGDTLGFSTEEREVRRVGFQKHSMCKDGFE